MVLSRFMICINLMTSDQIGRAGSAEELETRVRSWIDGFVNPDPRTGERSPASRPLREAKVVFEPTFGRPDTYTAVVDLRPWLPLEELSFPVRMTLIISQ
jgi:predicted component of type VI protein secretion system